jgi:uncharacterized protein (DUF58 family)
MSGLAAWLRPALAGLTLRGRSFLAAGGAAAGCALVLGQRDLLRVGVLLVALPLACAVVLGRARYRLALVRTINPQRVFAGSTARVRLELENLTRLPTRVLLAEDRVPYSLGPSPRFVLARLGGGRRAAVTYSLRTDVRGRYLVGPLRLRLADPFGMCELTRAFTATDPLVVVPPTFPLTPVQAGGMWVGTGESLARSAAASGEDDVATREYRYGDDLRRVHWRSTARKGELMVRRDEQPRQLRATVLLDARRDGHRGEGPASSFEWAVVAAASVGVHLAGQRYGVRLVLDGHPSSWTGPYSGDSAGQLLDELAVVESNGPESLTAALGTLARGGGDGLVVAVLGEIDDETATVLARLGRQGARGIAILLRTTAWSTLPPVIVADLDGRREHAAAVLRSGGWLVTDAGPEENVTQVWQRVAATGPGTNGWVAPGPATGSVPLPVVATAPAAGPNETTAHRTGAYGVAHNVFATNGNGGTGGASRGIPPGSGPTGPVPHGTASNGTARNAPDRPDPGATDPGRSS